MLNEINRILLNKEKVIEDWYQSKLLSVNPCFYASIDLRFSGQKLAPVDTNLFPAGFNNISSNAIQHASILAKNHLEKLGYHENDKILLIGESHDRNQHYQNNLKAIEIILKNAGYIVKIGYLDNSYSIQEGLLQANNFTPNLIILNNDLSIEFPQIFDSIKQKIIPHPDNGWFKRRKSNHFSIYNQLMYELENLVDLPSYFFTTEFDVCNDINFKTRTGMENLATKVESLLEIIKNKYKKLGINQEPYVVVKSDYGTYGMGVMIIKSAQEIISMNKKTRNQMHTTKSSVLNNQVIIQEGIKTIDKINNVSAEPMLYMVNNELVEFMYRINDNKDEFSNLNSKGMNISINSKSANYDDYYICCNFVAKIACLAASLETKEI